MRTHNRGDAYAMPRPPHTARCTAESTGGASRAHCQTVTVTADHGLRAWHRRSAARRVRDAQQRAVAHKHSKGSDQGCDVWLGDSTRTVHDRSLAVK